MKNIILEEQSVNLSSKNSPGAITRDDLYSAYEQFIQDSQEEDYVHIREGKPFFDILDNYWFEMNMDAIYA